MDASKLWIWHTRGLLGVVGMIQKLEQDTPAPPRALKELAEAKQLIDQLLASQQSRPTNP